MQWTQNLSLKPTNTWRINPHVPTYNLTHMCQTVVYRLWELPIVFSLKFVPILGSIQSVWNAAVTSKSVHLLATLKSVPINYCMDNVLIVVWILPLLQVLLEIVPLICLGKCSFFTHKSNTDFFSTLSLPWCLFPFPRFTFILHFFPN